MFWNISQFLFQVDEYFYGVRIFPGQDPASVYVGWVTPHYHYYDNQHFDAKLGVRKCRFGESDVHGTTSDR